MYTYVCISKRDSPIKGVSGLGTRAFEVLLIPNTFGSVALLFLQCNLLICHALFLSVCVGGGMEVYVCVRVCVCVCARVCVCVCVCVYFKHAWANWHVSKSMAFSLHFTLQ